MRGNRTVGGIGTLEGRSETVIGEQSRILNWPCWRDGNPIGVAKAIRGARSYNTYPSASPPAHKEVWMIPAVVTHLRVSAGLK